jgi:hypothetical protein
VVGTPSPAVVALVHGGCRRAGAVDVGPVDGPVAAALPAGPSVAAGPSPGRVYRVLVRAASDVVLCVRRRHIRAGAG